MRTAYISVLCALCFKLIDVQAISNIQTIRENNLHNNIVNELNLSELDKELVQENPKLPFIYIDNKLIALMESAKEFIQVSSKSNFDQLYYYFTHNFRIVPFDLLVQVFEDITQYITRLYSQYHKTKVDSLTQDRLSALLKELTTYFENIKQGQRLFLETVSRIYKQSMTSESRCVKIVLHDNIIVIQN